MKWFRETGPTENWLEPALFPGQRPGRWPAPEEARSSRPRANRLSSPCPNSQRPWFAAVRRLSPGGTPDAWAAAAAAAQGIGHTAGERRARYLLRIGQVAFRAVDTPWSIPTRDGNIQGCEPY